MNEQDKEKLMIDLMARIKQIEISFYDLLGILEGLKYNYFVEWFGENKEIIKDLWGLLEIKNKVKI